MMRRFYSTVLIFFLGYISSVSAQEQDSLFFSSEARQPFAHSFYEPFPDVMISDSLPLHDFGLEVGMSGFTDFDGGYGFNTYVAPTFSFQATRKLRVDVMGIMGATTAYNMPVYYDPYQTTFSTGDLSYNYLGIYAQGTYDITEKLYVGASVFASQAFNVDSPMNPGMNNLGSYGSSVYLGYKFSDSFKMEAEISISSGNSPYGRGRYGGGYYGTPSSFRGNPVGW